MYGGLFYADTFLYSYTVLMFFYRTVAHLLIQNDLTM